MCKYFYLFALHNVLITRAIANQDTTWTCSLSLQHLQKLFYYNYSF